MKAYIFDNDVFMSGYLHFFFCNFNKKSNMSTREIFVHIFILFSANFSEQYFTDRQDRYVLFKDNIFLRYSSFT